MDVASGLHDRLGSVPAIRVAADKLGAQLHDVRHADRTFATGKGTKRPGGRILTVGTDCSVGKKYTALALEAEMTRRGYDTEFCATGSSWRDRARCSIPPSLGSRSDCCTARSQTSSSSATSRRGRRCAGWRIPSPRLPR